MGTEDVPQRRAADHIPEHSEPEIHATVQTATNIGEDIKRTLRVLIVLTLIMYIFQGAGVLWTYTVTHENRNGLCAVRREAADRVLQGSKFLLQHPHGAFGLTSAQLQATINQSANTVNALKGLNC